MLDNTTTPTPHNYTFDQWKQILVNATERAKTDPNNPRWQQAISDARSALKTEISRQEGRNKVLSNFEMQEAQDPGFAGTLAGTALSSLGNAALETGKAVREAFTGQGLADKINEKLLGIRPAPEVTNVEQLLPDQTQQSFAVGRERHPVAEAIGETAPVAVPLIASAGGWAGQGMRLARQTKGLQRDILSETLNQMRTKGPIAAEQGGLRTDLLRSQVEQIPNKNQAALNRIALMEQQLDRGGPTLENLELRNELMRLKLELMAADAAESATGATGAVPKTGPIPPPTPPPVGGAPVPTPTPPTPPGTGFTANPATYPRTSGTGPTVTGPSPTGPVANGPVNPLDALQNLSAEGLESQPFGKTPPLEQSAAAPGVQEAQISRTVSNLLRQDPGKVIPGNPLAPEQFPLTQELIENEAGNMGQKAVQFGEGSPLNPAAQMEIKSLLGELSRILGKKGGM